MRHLQAELNDARRITKVEYVVIVLDGPNGLFIHLAPPGDNKHINAIMRSLRHMRVVRGSLEERSTDEITVAGVGGSAVIPDLGKVVYDAFRHKGITPRRR